MPSKERPPSTELRRAPLLDAQVEIAIAAGDLDARTDRLPRARQHRRPLPEQGAGRRARPTAGARLQLADRNAGDAQPLFAEAVRLWTEVGAPYETAVARLGLADAYRALGADHRATLETQAARPPSIASPTGADPDAPIPPAAAADPTANTNSFIGTATTGR